MIAWTLPILAVFYPAWCQTAKIGNDRFLLFHFGFTIRPAIATTEAVTIIGAAVITTAWTRFTASGVTSRTRFVFLAGCKHRRAKRCKRKNRKSLAAGTLEELSARLQFFTVFFHDRYVFPYRCPGFRIGYKKEKRGNLYCLLVPRIEAFALPDLVERAIAEASRWICWTRPKTTLSRYLQIEYTYSTRHLPLLHPWPNLEVCEVSIRQERALSKRFPLCLPSLQAACRLPSRWPVTGPLQNGLRCKFKMFFCNMQQLFRF